MEHACQYRAVTPSWRRSLPVVAAVVGALVAAALVYYLVPQAFGPFTATAPQQTITATVAHTVACDSAGAHDTVTFTVDGKQQQGRLNGCGNPEGDHIQVLLPDDPGPDATVQLAAAATPVPAGYRRAAFALLALAGVAGGGYCSLLRRGPREAAATKSKAV